MGMNREEMIEQLQWNSGGTGHGVCAVANSFLWSTSRPKHPRGDDDLKSIVAVSGPPDKYTDEELQKLVAFSERRTEDYDRRNGRRMGANLIYINKYGENKWLRKRMSWDIGSMFSDSLDEAITVFERD